MASRAKVPRTRRTLPQGEEGRGRHHLNKSPDSETVSPSSCSLDYSDGDIREPLDPYSQSLPAGVGLSDYGRVGHERDKDVPHDGPKEDFHFYHQNGAEEGNVSFVDELERGADDEEGGNSVDMASVRPQNQGIYDVCNAVMGEDRMDMTSEFPQNQDNNTGVDDVDMASKRPQSNKMKMFLPHGMSQQGKRSHRGQGCSSPQKASQHHINKDQSSANANGRHYMKTINKTANSYIPSRSHRRAHTVPKNTVPAKRPSRKKKQPKSPKTDAASDLSLSVLDLLGNLIGIGSYLFDVGTDYWVAYTHYVSRHWWWFGLTLSFVVGPSLVMTFFSTVWYIQESKLPDINKSSSDCDDTSTTPSIRPASKIRWVSRFIFLFLQIAPVLRYMDSIIYCFRSWKSDPHKEPHVKKHWYDRMLYEDTDATLLRLIECFMEAAPQLVLQLYIISVSGLRKEWYMAAAQVLSCVTSLFSLSWALAAYHRALRLSLQDKANMTWPGVVLQFFWRIFTIGARILAMALFASHVSPWVFSVAVAVHWFVMLIWCLTKSTKFCVHRWQEPLFNMVMAVVYIFSFLNLLEGHTRLRYMIFYSIIYIENLGMIMLWYTMEGTNMKWFYTVAMVAILFGFFIGICLQLIYYRHFHPNNYKPWSEKPHIKPIRCCISCSEMCNKSADGDDSLMTEIQRPKREQAGSSNQGGHVDTIVTRGLLGQAAATSTMV